MCRCTPTNWRWVGSPEGLRFHIRESIERAGAERIGHGVAVMSEDDPIGLLQEMAKKNVLVEICLTSNDVILGVSGDRHPLPVYMKYGVPVALATDDEGVSRSDMTHEYLRAAETYGLSYGELKRMARASWNTVLFQVIVCGAMSGSCGGRRFAKGEGGGRSTLGKMRKVDWGE